MKKIVKWSFMIGFIICLLGVGLITTGAMMGGKDGLASYLSSYQYPFTWTHDYIEELYETAWQGERRPETAIAGQPQEAAAEKGGQYAAVRKLDIEAGPGSIEILQEAREDSQDTSLRIVHEEGHPLQYRIEREDETLEINLPGGLSRRHGEWRMESLIIYVPEGYRFREVNIEALAGTVYADVLYADELELDVKAGSIRIQAGQVKTLEADCATGDIECMATVENSAEADCAAGKISFALAGSKDQYDYALECKTGTITMTDGMEEKYSDLWKKQYIDHGTGKQIELDCTAGNISVYFPDSL